MSYTVWVSGIPVPQGSMRGFVVGKRAVLTSDNAKLRPWRDSVVAAVREQVDRVGLIEGPVEVRLEFYFIRPSSHYGTKGLLPSAPTVKATKPDADKLARGVLDALVVARAIEDDARVWSLCVDKLYAAEPAEPGCWITVRPYILEAAA